MTSTILFYWLNLRYGKKRTLNFYFTLYKLNIFIYYLINTKIIDTIDIND